jgi:hypothetical protein
VTTTQSTSSSPDTSGRRGEVEIENEAGDDRGGHGEIEPGDDRRRGEVEAGDDHGGRGEVEPGHDHGGHRRRPATTTAVTGRGPWRIRRRLIRRSVGQRGRAGAS